MELPNTLARWYAAQSSIRRLRAVEDEDALLVFIALEPTSDGDDTLPVWLARSHDWANDLRSLTRRDVRLELLASNLFEVPHVGTDAAIVAELDWRETWIAG